VGVGWRATPLLPWERRRGRCGCHVLSRLPCTCKCVRPWFTRVPAKSTAPCACSLPPPAAPSCVHARPVPLTSRTACSVVCRRLRRVEVIRSLMRRRATRAFTLLAELLKRRAYRLRVSKVVHRISSTWRGCAESAGLPSCSCAASTCPPAPSHTVAVPPPARSLLRPFLSPHAAPAQLRAPLSVLVLRGRLGCYAAAASAHRSPLTRPLAAACVTAGTSSARRSSRGSCGRLRTTGPL
jgi:hypothetical protein